MMRSILLLLTLSLPPTILAVQPLSAQAAGAPSSQWSQASYVWDSEALLDPDQRKAELEQLRKAGMDKIYLGLKSAQLKDLATTRQRLEQKLQEEATRQGGVFPPQHKKGVASARRADASAHRRRGR